MRKCQKRPTKWQKRPIIRTKETYRYTGIPEGCLSVKRDLLYGKSDLLYGKRDLLYGKRDLLIPAYLRYA